MSENKGFRKMSELVDTLRDAETGLRKGSLGIDGLERACGDARDLYERLVVLRHKAREGMLKGQGQEPANIVAPTPTPTPVPVAPVEPAPTTPVVEAPAIRLDTRPMDPVRQTTLIEAIAATEQEEAPVMKTASEYLKESIAAKASTVVQEAAKATSVAEKLEKAHVDDLGKAISVSHKFWFTAELFNGDRGSFEKAIDRLNKSKDLDEAHAWLDSDVWPQLKTPAAAEAKTTFLDLLQRRFA